MKKPGWLINLLAEMKKEGKLPTDHTGEVTLTVNLLQGGITGAKLVIPELYK